MPTFLFIVGQCRSLAEQSATRVVVVVDAVCSLPGVDKPNLRPFCVETYRQITLTLSGAAESGVQLLSESFRTCLLCNLSATPPSNDRLSRDIDVGCPRALIRRTLPSLSLPFLQGACTVPLRLPSCTRGFIIRTTVAGPKLPAAAAAASPSCKSAYDSMTLCRTSTSSLVSIFPQRAMSTRVGTGRVVGLGGYVIGVPLKKMRSAAHWVIKPCPSLDQNIDNALIITTGAAWSPAAASLDITGRAEP